MNAFKPVIFVSMAALTACAPPVLLDTAPSQPLQHTKIQKNPKTGIIVEAPIPADKTDKFPGKLKAEQIPIKDDIKSAKTSKADKVETIGKTSVPSSWELSGAMAARSKNKSWSASVNWLQHGQNNYQIRLFGPLGSGTVLIQKAGGTVSYKDGPRSASSGNADQLLMKETGVRLPVNNLYYWVRGIPAPGAVQSAQRDSGGHLNTLRQAGYTISYGGYTTSGGAVVPTQIKLQGNGVFIKLIVRRWKI